MVLFTLSPVFVEPNDRTGDRNQALDLGIFLYINARGREMAVVPLEMLPDHSNEPEG
jgi:hypothetical protein